MAVTSGADNPDDGPEPALRDAVDRGVAGATLQLADLVRGQGRAAEAEELYRLAAERGDPGAMVHLGDMMRGVDNAASEQAYSDALERGETEAAVRLGDVFRVEGRLDEAEAAYRIVVEGGDDGEGRKRLGELLTARERFDEAAALYREGLKNGEFEMAVRLGDVLHAVGDLDGAEQIYRQAVDRGDPEANTRLGDLYVQLGRLADALSAYERGARTGDPNAGERAEEISRRLALPSGRADWVELNVLRGHEGPSRGCAFSPDGRLLATTGLDATIRLWDVASGREHAVLQGGEGQSYGCALSPDGRLLASPGLDATVRLWDVASAKEHAVLRGPEGLSRGCAFSPDGRLLASTGEDEMVRLWDVASAKEHTVLHGHEGSSTECAFSPDGLLLASTGEDWTVRLWDVASAKEHAVLRAHRRQTYGCAFSPDGLLLASTGRDGTVRLWDVASAKEHAVLHGGGRSYGCAFSPDGTLLASTGHDGPVRLWDVASAKEHAVLHGGGRSYGCAFSPDGTLLASTGEDGTVRLWGKAGALTDLPSTLGVAGDAVAVLPAVASDVPGGKDLLGVGGDVNAIANLVAASETDPPLSIGLFGDWGSGKSFFIGEVQKRVRCLASLPRGPGSAPYCSNVRNISFNAWHYADANLWASLVTHIFDELAKPELPSGAESEATTLAQIARLEEKLAESSALKERLQRAREHRRQVQARRKLLFWTWKLTGVRDERSLGDVESDVKEIRNAVKLLLPNAKVRLVVFGLAVIAALVALAVVVVAGGERVTQTLVAVCAAVAVPTSAFALIRKRVLRLLQQTGETARAIDVRDTDIDAELEMASAAELELQREMSDLSAGRRLARMASERSGDYREHLGMVSRIHNDLVQMSKLLRGEADAMVARSDAEADKDNDLPRIDRIVLYIDDLDRCPPRRVMEVLEAVHLILAVPLFVVVVAVDPRWLLQSLKLHYAELLAQETEWRAPSRDEQPGSGADSWGASPIDYLEKIIQVPFTLRPMNKDSAHSLVHGLLFAEGLEDEPAEPGQTEPAAETGAAEPTGSTESDQPTPRPKDGEPLDPVELLPQSDSVPVMPIERAPLVSNPSLDTRILVLTQAERDFAATVAGGLRTPRTVKKFTNLYRLLRAGLDERSGALERFLREDTGDTPEYQAVLILLAAIIAFTDDAPRFLAELLQQPTGASLWIDYLLDMEPPKRGGDLLDVLRAIAAEHDGERQWTCEPFQRWALEVSRYSFATGQEVFAHFNGAAPPSI